MPELNDKWEPLDPATECPSCGSADVSVEEETSQSIDYVCNACRHRWEEYR